MSVQRSKDHTTTSATLALPLEILEPVVKLEASSRTQSLSGPYPNGFIYAPTLSIADTNTTSFNLHELWVGCLNVNNTKNGYNAIQCGIYLQCTTR